jgi:general secretion pathway protein N
MARLEMTQAETMRTLGMGLTLLLVAALGAPAETSALTSDTADAEADIPRRADTPSTSSLWDSPVVPAPVVVKAPKPPAASERTPSANPLWAIPLATLSNTRDRPVFSSSRRPPAPAVAPTAAPKLVAASKPSESGRPPLSLVGTIASDDEGYGIFLDQSTNVALRLKIGEDYQGWKLRSVQGRDATVEKDQQAIILALPQLGVGQAAGEVRPQLLSVTSSPRPNKSGP